MNVAKWGVLAAILAATVAIVALMPDDPAAWFGLGLDTGLIATAVNWQLTKYVGCRRCAKEAWP